MAIVPKIPFKLQIIKEFPTKQIETIGTFSTDPRELWEHGIVSASIEENDEIDILFDSGDKEARLYLDALDIISDVSKVETDDTGRIYRGPSPKPFTLYKNNPDFDALRVDAFPLAVMCNQQTFWGIFEVRPKQLTQCEWSTMRDDLEKEINGLALDVVRRNIGLGDGEAGILPPTRFYDFLVIQKYSTAVLGALLDIAERPRFSVLTEYIDAAEDSARIFDKETVRRYLKKGGTETTYHVPIKNINYNIQENCLLKSIIIDYEHRLDGFLSWLEGVELYQRQAGSQHTARYEKAYLEGIQNFKDTAIKLRKATGILKSQSWFLQVNMTSNGYVPHSFALDSRYGILYRMHKELKHPEYNIGLNPEFSYTWKQSSSMYEMWCYIKICRCLSEKYAMSNREWMDAFNQNTLFPFLVSGTTVTFESSDIILKVVYDQFLPMRAEDTEKFIHPYYVIGKHNRPDITIDIYYGATEWYIGSVVLECKYRKLTSFYRNSENSLRSSVAQLEAYYNDTKSECYFDMYGKVLDGRPVRKVIALTPDVEAQNVRRNKHDINYSIILKAFKPRINERMVNDIMQEIQEVIDERLLAAKDLIEKLKHNPIKR